MKKTITFILVILSMSMYGQNIELDLSKNIDNTFKRTVPSNSDLKIILINRLPNPASDYSIEIIESNIPIQNLTLTKKTSDTLAFSVKKKACVLNDKIIALDSIRDEKILNDEITKLEILMQGMIKDITNGKNHDCTLDDVSMAESLIGNKTEQTLWSGKLNRGKQLSITVTRKTYDKKERKWIFILTTEKRGEWQISYGFSFISQIFKKENKYFSKVNENSGVDDETRVNYTITPENIRSKLAFSPSIFFSWYPTSSQNKVWHPGVSGGLGFDFDNVTVFLAPVLSFNQNLKIHIGLVAHQQRTLLGKYNSGDIINDPLNEEQLHEDKYQINPFFSLSFRFDENPFNQKSGE